MQHPVGNTTRLQSWLDLWRAGDESAREQIIQHSCERLRMLTHRMFKYDDRLRRWEQTDDVCQQAIIALHDSLLDIKPESVRQFLGLAALQIRRTLIDLARHHFGPLGAAGKHQTDGDGEAIQEVAAGTEPNTPEEWGRFHETVEKLPEHEQEVLSLMFIDGLTQSEAAEVLGVSERSVRRRWRSARCRLAGVDESSSIDE